MNFRKIIMLCAALTLSLFIFITDGHAKEQDALALQAMYKFLSWEKFWYGEFFGEDCYNKSVGKKVRIAIQHEMYSEIGHFFQCDGARDQLVKQKIFIAYIANTNFLFHGVWLGNKPVAEILMGSAPPGCNIDDLEPRVTNLLKDSRTAFLNVTLRPVEPYHLPPVAENLKEQNVLEAVKRSMQSFINSQKITRHGRLLLARFNNTDPFLLAYYEGDGNVYLLDFPSRKILSKKNICSQVSTAGPYLGEAPRGTMKRVMDHLLNKIKQNSIELQL